MPVSKELERLKKRASAPIGTHFCQYAVQKGYLQFWYDCAAYATEEIDGSYFCKAHGKAMRALT